MERENVEMVRRLPKQYGDKYPVLKESKEEVEVLEQSNSLRSKNGGNAILQKIIKIVHDNTEENIWNMIEKLKEELDGEEQLAMHCIANWKPERMRKLIESIFYNSKHNIDIYVRNEEGVTGKTQRQRETYAMVVEEDNKSYKNMFTMVKAAVGDKDISTAIKGFRVQSKGSY